MAKRQSRESPEVRDFILRTIPDHPSAVGAMAAEKFGLSRTAVARYLQRLKQQGLVRSEGKTSARTHTLVPLSNIRELIAVTPDMSESDVWLRRIEPHIRDLPRNIESICQYGFTEMFNNVIDHSGSPDATIGYRQDHAVIELSVVDHGVGIFEKIQKDFDLPDPRAALLELSKGKLTSDRSRHSGEGIFFTSRMFSQFTILSGHLRYSRNVEDDRGLLIETEDREASTKGTRVTMRIATDAAWTAKEIFDKYQNEDLDFAKTQVPLSLLKYGHEQLVSRSQAKRVLARFDRFEEVLLDFQGVNEIGQAFADEIFRVFAQQNPQIKIRVRNASRDVQRMIKHAQTTDPSGPEAF